MKAHIFKYILFFLINVGILNIVIYFLLLNDLKSRAISPNPIGSLDQKLEYYKLHRKDYKVVFIGDSRTFTNINNCQIDTILQTNSFNMAMWANWFPTQYSFLQDFLPQVPDGTTLIFSLGYQNFNYGDIQETYPIEYDRAKEYINWGFSLRDLKKTLVYNNSKVLPILFLSQSHNHAWLKEEMDNYLAVFSCKNKSRKTEQIQEEETRQVIPEKIDNNPAPVSSANKNTVKYLLIGNKNNSNQSIFEEFSKNPEAGLVKQKFQGDTLTSVEVFWKKGNYWRIEIDTFFFRKKQLFNTPAKSNLKTDSNISPFIPDSRYWKNFEAITRLFKTHSKRLNIIFNKVDEAPYTYAYGRKSSDNFLNNIVKNYIINQGFAYITVDVRDMPDSYYFDNNHMNSKGTIIYTQRLASILKEKIK
jgi:hypothetical protein